MWGVLWAIVVALLMLALLWLLNKLPSRMRAKSF
jgi:hypothetical protein